VLTARFFPRFFLTRKKLKALVFVSKTKENPEESGVTKRGEWLFFHLFARKTR
jgi:hypothetical protein